MHTLLPIRRLSLALALGLGLASLAAVAGGASEVTEVRISSDGTTETIVLDDLKVGESRQLYSEAGTLVTATRTADAIELDVGGDKTRITLFDPALSSAASGVRVDVSGDEDGTQRVVKIRHDGQIHAGQGSDGKRTVVLVSGDGADVHTLDSGTDDIRVLLDGLAPDGDGKHVVVKRRIVRDEAVDAK